MDPACVYLDHAAATPLDPEVDAAMRAVQADAFANPSSQHACGRAARRVLEDARERIVAILGGRTTGTARDRFVFTSGASESNHLAIVGMAAAAPHAGEVFWSRRDHTSSRQAVVAAIDDGWRSCELSLDASGTAAASARRQLAMPRRPSARLVSLTLVCGQTGTIEDCAAIAPGAASGDLLVHVDATQSAGFLGIDVHGLGAATLCVAPHKFGGPRGIGGLWIRHDVGIAPLRPGPQEAGLRGGTEAVVLAAGFARAVEIAARDRGAVAGRVAGLRDRLEAGIVEAARAAGLRPQAVAGGARAPHIATIAFPGLDRQAFVMAADLAGICLSTGTACASGSSEPAPAIVALGLDAAVSRGAVRFSVGRTTTAADVDCAVVRLAPLFSRRTEPGVVP